MLPELYLPSSFRVSLISPAKIYIHKWRKITFISSQWMCHFYIIYNVKEEMRIVYVVFHSFRWTTSEISFFDVYQWCRKITYVYTYISPVLYTKYIYIRTKYMDEDGDVNKRGLLLSLSPKEIVFSYCTNTERINLWMHYREHPLTNVYACILNVKEIKQISQY